jgi:hypothetical protein
MANHQKRRPSPPELPPLDVDRLLNTLAEIRKAIPPVLSELAPPPAPEEGRVVAKEIGAGSVREFEYAAAIEGNESVRKEISAAVEAAEEKLLNDAMNVYFAAEELARDPEHANLIDHVNQMREAYQQSYGTPIPPTRAEWEALKQKKKKKRQRR